MRTQQLRKHCINLLAITTLALAPVTARAADAIEILGDIAGYGMPLVAGGISWAKDDKEGVWQLGKTWLVGVGSAYGLKYLIDTERPNGDRYGFPSSHTTSTFATAGYLHRRYGFKKAWPAYIVAGFTGWSRIHADEHDWEDIIGGAAIGLIAARIFTDKFENLPPIEVTFNSKENIYAVRTKFRF